MQGCVWAFSVNTANMNIFAVGLGAGTYIRGIQAVWYCRDTSIFRDSDGTSHNFFSSFIFNVIVSCKGDKG